ncbi:unnamed protein product [Protopolystoma xenopodis]|uniref:Uncharacterized protein n=1 Tax=Protopolystoma xenopodis TaxID=117903 RepID=A0A3S5B4A0_9PLAT|nr:unnamed protein product [Protopolystoma xenopodis]
MSVTAVQTKAQHRFIGRAGRRAKELILAYLSFRLRRRVEGISRLAPPDTAEGLPCIFSVELCEEDIGSPSYHPDDSVLSFRPSCD